MLCSNFDCIGHKAYNYNFLIYRCHFCVLLHINLTSHSPNLKPQTFSSYYTANHVWRSCRELESASIALGIVWYGKSLLMSNLGRKLDLGNAPLYTTYASLENPSNCITCDELFLYFTFDLLSPTSKPILQKPCFKYRVQGHSIEMVNIEFVRLYWLVSWVHKTYQICFNDTNQT